VEIRTKQYKRGRIGNRSEVRSLTLCPPTAPAFLSKEGKDGMVLFYNIFGVPLASGVSAYLNGKGDES